MKARFLPQSPVARAMAAVAVAGAIGASASIVYAATAAGTQIKNLATVTYEDASGNVYSAQSNEAIVTVAQVYSATLGVDVDATAAAGQIVYLPYVLTNTGNGPDNYNLAAINGITGGDVLDSSSITVYQDTNGSGEPDAGEPVVSTLALQADDSVNLVVGVQVPATAAAGDTLGITLTAEAENGTGAAVTGSVTDVTAGKGRDGADGTNESLITVTNNAALVTTKSSVHDPANNQISYTVTVRNNGNQPAQDVVIFDGLPANTTLVTSGVSGLLTTNGDTTDTAAVLSETGLGLDLNADGDVTDADEAAIGLDLNNDGDSVDTGINGIYAVDAELPPTASVSLTFTVQYDPATLGGGYIVQNQGHAAGDTDDDGTADSLVSSNVVQDTINAAFGVAITDTGTNAGAGVNDGGDDDAVGNDDQFVDQAAAGGTVLFTNVITNLGNSSDIFELSVAPGNYPAGTVFTFFDDSGVVQLGDTNGSGVDSGVIAAGASKTIIVKATLPAGASGDAPAPATEYEATVTATSANDPSATPETDTVAISLGTIITARVDLHNATGGTIGTDEDALGAAPYSAISTFSGQTGTTVSIPLYIDNESGGPDSYTLASGMQWDGTTLGALLPGWTVEFFVGDGAGNPTGAAITNTPVLPGGSVDFEIIAVVSVPSDATQAVNGLSYDNDGDGTDDVLDGNADGDGDYPVFFQVSSLNTGASDIKLDAVDVNADRAISLVTPGSKQIEPGGTVDYGHTLSNNGNLNETLELSASNSQTGWSNTVSVDTNGDGTPDTILGNLVPGQITVQQANGVDITINVTDTDGDGNPEFTLLPGHAVPLTATVFAPANAAPGQVDSLTISATNVSADPVAPSATVTDQTTVINGQILLTKTVAVDTDCDGTADTAFAQVQATGIEPNQCAIWQVTAVNQGAANANNVTITDAVTAFSTYEAGSLAYCINNACTPATVTDASDTDAGTITGTNIVFYVGTGADPVAGEGGVLVPGEQATAQFRVRVQ